MTLTTVLPRELIELVIEFYSRDDSDSAVLRRVSKLWLELSPNPRDGSKLYGVMVYAFVSSISRLQWARENGCPWDQMVVRTAAEQGHLEVVKWAVSQKCPLAEWWTCAWAARGGQLGVLKWLRDNGCRWDNWTCTLAARGGHLELLKWARENGCPWEVGSMVTHAAETGHLEVLKWLITQGCSVNRFTSAWAARGGQLEILKWLKANDYPWDGLTIAWAEGAGHLEVSRWARENGCPEE